MATKKPCKECPWVLTDKKSVQWQEYIQGKLRCKTENLQQITTVVHRCHMKNHKSFDEVGENIFTNPTTDLCIGSVQFQEKQDELSITL